jgi:hypothetical protein
VKDYENRRTYVDCFVVACLCRKRRADLFKLISLHTWLYTAVSFNHTKESRAVVCF